MRLHMSYWRGQHRVRQCGFEFCTSCMFFSWIWKFTGFHLQICVCRASSDGRNRRGQLIRSAEAEKGWQHNHPNIYFISKPLSINIKSRLLLLLLKINQSGPEGLKVILVILPSTIRMSYSWAASIKQLISSVVEMNYNVGNEAFDATLSSVMCNSLTSNQRKYRQNHKNHWSNWYDTIKGHYRSKEFESTYSRSKLEVNKFPWDTTPESFSLLFYRFLAWFLSDCQSF